MCECSDGEVMKSTPRGIVDVKKKLNDTISICHCLNIIYIVIIFSKFNYNYYLSQSSSGYKNHSFFHFFIQSVEYLLCVEFPTPHPCKLLMGQK